MVVKYQAIMLLPTNKTAGKVKLNAGSSVCGARLRFSARQSLTFPPYAALTIPVQFAARLILPVQSLLASSEISTVNHHVDVDTGDVTDSYCRCPFEVTEESVFASSLSHERNTGC
jgi:hypothetical protein